METFEKYISEINPDWRQLPLETIAKAKELFDLKNKWADLEKNALNKQLNMGSSNSANIDYTNDFVKAGAERVRINNMLDNLIKPLENTNEMVNENSKTI